VKETLGPVSTYGRELLPGWWWPIGFMVSFIIFTSVRNILNNPSCNIKVHFWHLYICGSD
jgi:hypothetical protein